VDVLPDPAIRQELSALSNWPTIPQVFVRGELVGGADIVEDLAESGELREKLQAALGEGYEDARSEKVVALGAPNQFRLAR
jgi:monothiol glutaredoxin